MEYIDRYRELCHMYLGDVPTLHILDLYCEGEVDYLFANYISDNIKYVIDGSHEIDRKAPLVLYGKSDNEIIEDCISLMKYLISTGDFSIAKFDLEKRYVEITDSVNFINGGGLRQYVTQSVIKNDESYEYCLEKKVLGKHLPDVIPENIKKIFSGN